MRKSPSVEPNNFPVEVVKVADLKPHPQNYRVHPEEQIEEIAASVRAHGIYRPVVVANDNTILAGHGLVLAVKRNELDEIPVYRYPVAPDSTEALKVLSGDNELGHMAEVDSARLLSILRGIRDDHPNELYGTGFDEARFAALVAVVEPEEEPDKYTRKVVSPVYQVTGAKPKVKELVDRSRTDALLAEINEAEMPKELRTFLQLAAYRHLQFDYAAVAEFYAHAEPEVQELMEASALVIIDFDDAIERGFVKLSTDLGALWEQDHGGS